MSSSGSCSWSRTAGSDSGLLAGVPLPLSGAVLRRRGPLCGCPRAAAPRALACSRSVSLLPEVFSRVPSALRGGLGLVSCLVPSWGTVYLIAQWSLVDFRCFCPCSGFFMETVLPGVRVPAGCLVPPQDSFFVVCLSGPSRALAASSTGWRPLLRPVRG